eukprot:COSAG05_NODE_12_length_37297_cov_117.537072_8_plen_47_part_00
MLRVHKGKSAKSAAASDAVSKINETGLNESATERGQGGDCDSYLKF